MRKRLNKVIFLIIGLQLFLGYKPNIHAQDTHLTPTLEDLQNLKFETAVDLAFPCIVNLIQDKDGFLWVLCKPCLVSH